jgi:type I restriction enzyme S subunit
MMDFEGRAHYPIALESLPRGWSAAFLEDICASIQSGFASGEHNATGDGIPHVRPMNINRLGQLVFDEVKYVPRVKDERRLMRGDVVFNNTNSPVLIGKTCAVSTNEELAFSNHMTRLRPVDGIDHRFLSNQLHYLWMAGFFLHRCVKHVNQASVSSDTLGSTVPVVLPPVPEQHRIVSAIESYFTRLDDAVATLERVQRNLKRYRASVLKAAVEGRLVPTEAELARAEGRSYEPASVLLTRILAERRRRWEEAELKKMTAKGKAPKDDKWKAKYVEPVAPDTSELPELPEGWCWASVDQLGDVSGGLTQNAKREVLPLQLPFLRVANVYANELRLDEIKTIGVSDPEVSRVRLAPGDLLVVEGNGSIEQIGRVALWDGTIDPCLHQNHLIKVRFTPVVLATWSLCWMLAPAGRVAIERAASSTSGLHTLSLSKVQRLPVPLAPLLEQARIASEVDRVMTIALAAEGDVATNTQRLARLRQSILKWAFEGRLVDQDPTDEPASVLLEHIRAERASANDTPVRRARRRRGASA